VNFLYNPDTALTPSELETLALDLLAELPISGVEGLWLRLRDYSLDASASRCRSEDH